MPQTLISRSPARPSRSPETTGTPAATQASKPRYCSLSHANSSNSDPKCAINCLLAVTTDLCECSARRTQSCAGSNPPNSSMITSTSDASTSSTSSVHITPVGIHSAILDATRRLHIWVSSRVCSSSRASSRLATARPTVPKPTIATLQLAVGPYFFCSKWRREVTMANQPPGMNVPDHGEARAILSLPHADYRLELNPWLQKSAGEGLGRPSEHRPLPRQS